MLSRTSALVLTILIVGAVALAQKNQFGNIAERQRSSTVLGGTGMFNTFSTRTLYKSEFNFAAFWNRFNRDPAGWRIDQAPFNFTVGLTNRGEVWVDWVTWQKTRSKAPILRSGYQYYVTRIPAPQREVIKPCGPIVPFNSAGINNEHKACLDQIPHALELDPRAALVIDGHHDSSERVEMSLNRAFNARDYLVSEKRVDPARITVRNFGDACPQERGDPEFNRKVEMWILPERTSIADIAAVKRCRAGSMPREITDEGPAQGEPVRPSRSKRPERIGALAEQNKRFATSGSPTTNSRSGRRRAPASVVWAVSANMVGGALRVVVDIDGAVQYKDFILSDPSRIVIDLTGVRNALGSKTIPVVGGLVDRVRVGEPGPGVVRIVIDVRAKTRYLVLKDGSALIIIIGEEGLVAGSGGSR